MKPSLPSILYNKASHSCLDIKLYSKEGGIIRSAVWVVQCSGISTSRVSVAAPAKTMKTYGESESKGMSGKSK